MVSKYAKGAQVNTSEFAANRTAEKGNKRRETPSAWTKANPKFKYGEAMIREKENDSCGPSSVALHTYYLAACAEQKVGITVNFNPFQLGHTESADDFVVGFNDLYDLFNLDGLDMSLLRCFSV